MKSAFATLLAIAVCLCDACLAADDGYAFFEREIRPVLVEHCYPCHSAESDIQGGLRLDTRSGIAAGGDSGAAIVPGNPQASLLVEAIRYQNRDLQMPPQNALPDHVIKRFEEWIEMGAPDPREETPSSTLKPTGMSIEEGREFWSFQPVKKPPVPELDSPFVRNAVDAFVLEKLLNNDLSPAPLADRRTLIRRVTQDLIGLPPTPDEIAAFLADDSPEAFNKVVDRLLHSKQYGVRWARHWLDVARYADSNGLDENIGFGNAWRYRDYVVDSINADKPYDEFLIEQLAGDLLPNRNEASITATGFLLLGPKVLAEPDIEKLHMDTIDEQLDTLGKAFLGMTFGCARCHDHKFDPIKQTDYYALAAIFKSTKTFGEERLGAIKFWHEHSLATEEDEERIKKVDEELKKLKAAASSFKSQQLVQLRSEARSKAVEYLSACCEFEPDATLRNVTTIATTRGLHPRILHHCRRHLEYHRDDPFFSAWHDYALSNDLDGLREHYSTVFEEAETALAEARKEDAKAKTLSDERLESARAALYDKAGFLAVPAVDAFAFDSDTLNEYYRLLNVARDYESNAPDEPALMAVGDGDVAKTIPVFIRGNHKRPGDEVTRGFPEVMSRPSKEHAFPDDVSGRLELARWMADAQHPLTARVAVNRIWAWHFGQGLVASTENFGLNGDRPANQKLLDWLAAEFVESGWSIKAMHRLILGSNTWRMASQHPNEAACTEADPANRMHWKQNMRRLEAEQIRDSLLAVAGRLDQSLGGKTLPLRNRQFVFNHTSEDHTTYESRRRAIYLPVIRNNLYPLFEQFDFPDPTMPTGVRNATVIATQALVMMNDPLVVESAEAMTESVMPLHEEQRFQEVYLRCFGRRPTSAEMDRGKAFINRLTAQSTETQAWTLFCQGILASNEFMYLK